MVTFQFKGKEYEVSDLENFDFSKVRIAFFSAGGKISERFAEKASKNCLVIDNSSYYRMDPEVPLIVPQVNSEALKEGMKKNIIANPTHITAKTLRSVFLIFSIIVRHSSLFRQLQY